MKNFLKVAACVVLVIALMVGGWFLYLIYRPPLAIEDILPSKAVFYVRLAHAAERLQEAESSEFWKNISTINVPKVLARNQFPKEEIDQFERWQSEAVSFFKNPLARNFLGKEIAFAAYRHTDVDIVKNPQDAYGFLMVIRLTPSVQAAEFVSHLSNQWGDQISTSEETYRGKDIVDVQLKERKASFKYVRLRDLLVITRANNSQLKETIDILHREKPSLSSDPDFISAKSKLYPSADGILYLNIQSFKADLKKQGWMEGALAQTAGFKTYAFAYLPGDITKYKFVVNVDSKEVMPALRRVLSCVPQENSSLGFVPPNVIGYQWSSCYDFKGSWQQAREQLHAMPELNDQMLRFKKSIEKRTGLKVATDILPILGQEAGGYITDVDTLGAFPYPRFLAFVKINDRAKAEDIFKRIVKSPLGLVQQEEYNNEQIRYLSLPLGSNMDPAYCFVGDYLLFASSRQLLKKSIDIYHDPKRSLRSEKSFNALELGSKEKIQTVAFVKMQEFSRRMQGLVDWGNRYLSAQVGSADAYKKDGQDKKKELGGAIAIKDSELSTAIKKLEEWKSKPLTELRPEEQSIVMDTVAHLGRNVSLLRDEISSYKAQQVELDEALASYQIQAESAKLFMFNSQNVVIPILKGLGSVHVQGMKVTLSEQAIETELLFN